MSAYSKDRVNWAKLRASRGVAVRQDREVKVSDSGHRSSGERIRVAPGRVYEASLRKRERATAYFPDTVQREASRSNLVGDPNEPILGVKELGSRFGNRLGVARKQEARSRRSWSVLQGIEGPKPKLSKRGKPSLAGTSIRRSGVQVVGESTGSVGAPRVILGLGKSGTQKGVSSNLRGGRPRIGQG